MADDINFASRFSLTSNEEKRVAVADMYENNLFLNDDFKAENPKNYSKAREFFLEQVADDNLYDDRNDMAFLEDVVNLTFEAAQDTNFEDSKSLQNAKTSVLNYQSIEREQQIETVLNHLNHYGTFAADGKYGEFTISEADFRNIITEQREYFTKYPTARNPMLVTGAMAPNNDVEILNDRIYQAWPALAEEELGTRIDNVDSQIDTLNDEILPLTATKEIKETEKKALTTEAQKKIDDELKPLRERITVDGRLKYVQEQLALKPEDRALQQELDFLQSFKAAENAQKELGTPIPSEMRNTFLAYTNADNKEIKALEARKEDKNIANIPEIAQISNEIANLKKQIDAKEKNKKQIWSDRTTLQKQLNKYLSPNAEKVKLERSLKTLEANLKTKESTKLLSLNMFGNLGARAKTIGKSYNGKVKDLAKEMQVTELDQWLTAKEDQDFGYQAELKAVNSMNRRTPREKNAYENAKKRLESKKEIFEAQKKALEEKAKENGVKIKDKYTPLKDKAKVKAQEDMGKVFFDEKQKKLLDKLKSRAGNQKKDLENLIKEYVQKAVTSDGEFRKKLKSELGMSDDEIERFVGFAQELNGLETTKEAQPEEEKKKEDEQRQKEEEINKNTVINSEEHQAETNYNDKPWAKVSENTFYKEATDDKTGQRNVTVTSKDGIPSVEEFQKLLENYKDTPIQIGKGEDKFKLNLMEAALRSDVAINMEGMSEEDKKLYEQAKENAAKEVNNENKPIILEQTGFENSNEKTDERTPERQEEKADKKHILTQKQKDVLDASGMLPPDMKDKDIISWEKLDAKSQQILTEDNLGQEYMNSKMYGTDFAADKAERRTDLFKDVNLNIDENNAVHKLDIMKSVTEMKPDDFKKFSALDSNGNPQNADWGSLTDDERKLLSDLNKVSNAKGNELKGGDRTRALLVGRLVGQYKETVEKSNTTESKRTFYNSNVKPYVKPQGRDRD